MHKKDVPQGEALWKKGDPAVEAFLVSSGCFVFSGRREEGGEGEREKERGRGRGRERRRGRGRGRRCIAIFFFNIIVVDLNLQPFTRGAFLGEVEALSTEEGGVHTTSVTTLRSGSVYTIQRKDLMHFWDQNPGVQLSFLGIPLLFPSLPLSLPLAPPLFLNLLLNLLLILSVQVLFLWTQSNKTRIELNKLMRTTTHNLSTSLYLLLLLLLLLLSLLLNISINNQSFIH